MEKAQGQVPSAVPTMPPEQTTTPTTTATPAPTTKKIVHTGNFDHSSPIYKSGFVKLGPDAPPPVPPPDKYHSIHTLKRADKIAALKDTKLNPNLIEDGYDQLAHGLHLWTVTGAKAKADNNISFDDQKTIASNFYDRIIAPAYGHIYQDAGGAEPLSKDIWMKQAYEDALNYKIEDAYTNNWTASLKHGWNSGLAATARAADRVTTMLGNVFDDTVAQYRKERAWRAQSDLARKIQLSNSQADPIASLKVAGGTAEDVAKTQNWMERVKNINQNLAADKKDSEVFGNAVQRGARYQGDHRQFWADALPTRDGWLNKTTSFIAEQAGQLPIFAAMELGKAPFAAAGEVLGLSKALEASPVGRRVSGYLMAGAEGLAYGAAVRKQDDPGEMWRDAVGFAAFHGMFDVAGLGLKKLVDVAPESMLPKILRKQETLDLAQKGMRRANPVEVYDDHKTEVANNLFVGGIGTQRAIYVDALHHIAEFENAPLSPKQVREAEAALLEKDPARYAPVLSAAKFIRSLLGNKKLSDIQPGSEDEKFLSSRLAQLITDAGSEMNSRVKGMGEQTEAAAPTMLKAPAAKNTLAYYVAKVQADLEKNPGAAKLVTQEQVMKAATKKYAEDLQNAAEDAEKELATPKTKKAANVAERRKDTPAAAAVKKNPLFRTRSSYSTDKYGQPAVSYSINPDFTVQLSKYRKTAKKNSQTLQQFFTDMHERDFMSDIAKHFYPDSLRDAGIFFEGVGKYDRHRNLISPPPDEPFAGNENPNFLAFMYNYLKQMPKEFGQELEERLINTMKVQKYMSGKKPTEPQLAYYAKAMYNHVDNFLGSGRWPKEANIFRSSNENMFQTTVHQRQLLVEKQLQEQKNLKDMFAGADNKKALSLALETHDAFAKLRMHEFDNAHPAKRPAAQEHIAAYDDVIADLQTKTGAYERWDY